MLSVRLVTRGPPAPEQRRWLRNLPDRVAGTVGGKAGPCGGVPLRLLDFADGAIAYEGRWLGATEFLSFDGRAVKQLAAQGLAARVPG